MPLSQFKQELSEQLVLNLVQPEAGVLKCSLKNFKIHRKTPAPEPATLLKRNSGKGVFL